MARIGFRDQSFCLYIPNRRWWPMATGGRFAMQEDAMRRFGKAGLISTALLGAMATTASAEIRCQDGSQLIQGNWMATPYCQDKLLAEVANARGFTTSLAAIRNNPNHKKELCRFLYTDIRVQMTCMDAGVPEYYSGR
jgi:hypothetical protein